MYIKHNKIVFIMITYYSFIIHLLFIFISVDFQFFILNVYIVALMLVV